MNKEKLNELRSKISIPLVQAMKLLKQYDENIEQCIQAFHDENIKKICEETGCDLSIILSIIMMLPMNIMWEKSSPK